MNVELMTTEIIKLFDYLKEKEVQLNARKEVYQNIFGKDIDIATVFVNQDKEIDFLFTSIPSHHNGDFDYLNTKCPVLPEEIKERLIKSCYRILLDKSTEKAKVELLERAAIKLILEEKLGINTQLDKVD